MKAGIILCITVLLFVPAPMWAEEAAEEASGKVTAVQGDVQVGREGEWKKAAVGDVLHEGQVLKTGVQSSAEISFEEELTATVGGETEIGIADLLLKTRLERMKSRITKPSDTQKVEIQVTPTTGVRGTEQTEEKAEELKRDHFWNEDTPASQ